MTEQLSYESYCRLRQGGEPASKVYQVWKEHQLKQDSMDAYQILGEIVVGVMVHTITAYIVAALFYISDHPVWITSPSGNTKRQLPLSQALRIIKKRQWQFIDVVPIKPRSPISRRKALKILLFSDNNRGHK